MGTTRTWLTREERAGYRLMMQMLRQMGCLRPGEPDIPVQEYCRRWDETCNEVTIELIQARAAALGKPLEEVTDEELLAGISRDDILRQTFLRFALPAKQKLS